MIVLVKTEQEKLKIRAIISLTKKSQKKYLNSLCDYT